MPCCSLDVSLYVDSLHNIRLYYVHRVKTLSKSMLSSACVSCATQGDDKNDVLFCDGCDVAHCQNCVGLTTVGALLSI